MKGWRTVIVNAVVALGGVIVATKWGDVLPPKYAVFVTSTIIPLVNIGMRYITTTTIGRSS